MTQEEKDLLLKDLCARLPYGVICALRPIGNVGYYDWDLSGELLDDLIKKDWGDVKPYLRTMSSMTKNERLEISDFTSFIYKDYHQEETYSVVYQHMIDKYIDYLNSHFFDWRGLIPMGLALEAKEGMYNIE